MARGKRRSGQPETAAHAYNSDPSFTEAVESRFTRSYTTREQLASRQLFCVEDIPSLWRWVHAHRVVETKMGFVLEFINTNEMERFWFDQQLERFTAQTNGLKYPSDTEIAEKFGDIGMYLAEKKDGTLELRPAWKRWHERYRQAGFTLRRKIVEEYYGKK